jgi:SSS family solute:Na+ symporter
VAHYESIYQGVNTLVCYIAPPITVVFVWGIFWRRASAAAAFATLLIGSFLGLGVFLIDFFKDSEWLKQYIAWDVPFMMAAFYLFVICSAVLIVVSLWKPAPPSARVDALVWKSPLEALRGEAWPGIGNYRRLAAILFVSMVVLYVIFA